MARRPSRGAGGYTLIEIAISSVLFGVILLATVAATLSTQKTFDNANALGRLDGRTQRALSVIVDEFGTAGSAGLTPNPTLPLGSDHVTYRRPLGLAANAIVWDDASTVRFEYTADEPNNGSDDDGDGWIDEGRVVLVTHFGTAAEKTVILALNVPELMPGETANGLDDNQNGLTDERGFALSVDGAILTVELCSAGQDSNGHPIQRVQRTSIALRN